jgi:DNA-binding transcriptional LysR family regulator
MKLIRFAYFKMEWQQIIGFYHVARLGSFTKAAAATLRTQSALSQQIKSLEEEFGCLLIERIRKGKLRLTPAGEEFLRFATESLEKHACLIESLAELQGIQTGTLRVAAPYTTLHHLLPNFIQSYLEQFPRIQLTILDRPQETVIELLKSGDVDFGIVLESSVPRDLIAFRWKRVETVLLTPTGHPLTTLGQVTLDEIAKYPLILPPKGQPRAGRHDVEARLQDLGLTYRVIMESSNVDLSSLYAEMGLGVSFATVVRDLEILKNRNLELIPLDHCFEPDHIAVIPCKKWRLSSHKAAFLSLLLSVPAEEIRRK